MDAPRWKEVRAQFDELVELAPAERDRRLAVLERGDPDLHAALVELLAADPRTSGVLKPAPAPGPTASAPGGADPFGLTGRVIGPFLVQELIAAGGMGAVYRADDTRLGRPVALKFLLPQLQLDPGAKARFIREARAVATLDHPNLCTIHEVGESEDGRLYLAMALYRGETLRTRLDREGPLELGEAVEIARQVARGLACVHEAGLVHRDLKPGNLMLLPDGTVRILDFGLAKSRGQSLTGPGATPGTVAYMAPEQIRGEAADARADLWALGVVLYEMLTGRRPFSDAGVAATSHAILLVEPTLAGTLRPETPAALQNLVEDLLCKDPDGRFGSAAALAVALEALATGAGKVSTGAPRRMWRRRPTPRSIAVVGIALVLAALVGVAVLMRGMESRAPLNPRRVVVAPFRNATGDPALEGRGRMAAHWITLGLTEHSIAEVAAFSPEDEPILNGGMLQQLARRTGAGLVVWGSYVLQGDSVLMIATITDAEKGTVLRELGPYGAAITGPLREFEQLRAGVQGALALHLNPDGPLEPEAGQAPPTFAAYQAYIEGWEALKRADFRGWSEGARRALALDSTFVQVVGELTWAHIGLGECAPIDSIWQEVQRRRDGLPQSVLLEVGQTHALCRRDYDAAWDMAERRLRLSPHSAEAQLHLAFAGIWAGRLQESEAIFRSMDLTRGVQASNPFTDLAYIEVLHLLGRNQEAVRVASVARERHPHFPMRFYFGLASLAALGRVEEMEARIAEARNVIRPGGGADTYRDMADELAWHGHEDAAKRFAVRALEAYDERFPPAGRRTAFFRVARAGALLHLERWTEMRAAVDSIQLQEGSWEVGIPPRTENQGQVLALRGIAAAKGGDEEHALQALAAITGLPDDEGAHYWKTREFWEAQVLAAMGRREEALRRLRAGRERGGLPMSEPRLTHDEAGFRDLWHDPEFEALFAAR